MNKLKLYKNKDVILRNIHSTYFLINSKEKYWENNSIVKINDIGKIIWESLENTSSNNIIAKIIKLFNINSADIEMVKSDVYSFLETLYKLGYLKYE